MYETVLLLAKPRNSVFKENHEIWSGFPPSIIDWWNGNVSTQGPGQTGLPLREVRQLVDPVGFDDKGFSTKLLEHRSRLSTMEERSTLLRSSARRYRRSGCTPCARRFLS